MLEQKLFHGETNREAMKTTLQGQAYKIVKDQFYPKPLTPEELTIYKDTLADLSVKKNNLVVEFEKKKEEHKEAIKPLDRQYNEAREAIKTKSVQVEGDIYLIPDMDNKIMGLYDGEGNLIGARPFLPEERQDLVVQQHLFKTAM